MLHVVVNNSSLQEPEIVHWVNEVLLQSLDPILLPVYLDALQVLKSKVRLYILAESLM